MDRYEDSEYIDPDTSTFLDFGNSHVFVEDDGIKGAIKAYRSAYKIKELIQNTGYDCTLYSGYIYYDEYYGDWRATLDHNEIDNFNERNWKTIGNTWVEER